jgi:hypothetical protein
MGQAMSIKDMNIYELARYILQLYKDSETALIWETYHGSKFAKFAYKIKTLDEKLSEFFVQIAALEEETTSGVRTNTTG